MQELQDILITTGVGLIILGVSYALDLFVGIIKVLFTKDMKWSWKKMGEDLLKAFMIAIATEAWVALWYCAGWYANKVGLDIEKFTSAMSIAGMIGGITAGAFWYLASAGENLLNFLNTKHIELPTGEPDYKAVADKIREFADTVTKKSGKELIEETGEKLDGKDIEEEEAGQGGIANTYPEPYRSAPKDSMLDPSTCYNREAQPAGTMVTMEDGSYKAIEDVRVGDRLWNHDATEIVTVKSLWSDEKPVYNIRTALGEVRFTGEHPLFVSQNRWAKPARGNLKAYGKPRFVKTRNLKPSDKILVPEIPSKSLGLTPQELMWLGFYLGDGTKATKSDKCPVYRLCVADGRKRDFVDALGIDGSYSAHAKTDNAKFFTLSKKSSPALREVLDSIAGKDFAYLPIPEEVFYIVLGFLEADGHKVYENVYSASSTDKKLLLAIQRMVISIGGSMSIHKKYDAGELDKFGKKVSAKACWEANINLEPKRSAIHELFGGKYATVFSVEKGEPEKVYNIEVSGSHTYIADNYGVHNCVSYCAWKICEIRGSWPPRTGSMSAKYWVDRLPSWGYKEVPKPQNGGKYVGVSQAGTYGHVMWFEFDSTISEYNYANAGNFGVRQINISQYKWYEIVAPPAPAPTPQPTPKPGKKVSYTYKQGDTFGQVICNLGLKTSHGLWGPDGDVAYYTQQLVEQGALDKNGNVIVGKTIYLTPRDN